MSEPRVIFDAHLQPAGLSLSELKAMRAFGVAQALLAAVPTGAARTHTAVIEQLTELVRLQPSRVQSAGIRSYVAVGLHPLAIPRRGLHEVLSALPGYFRGGKVIALGAIGLHHGGPLEEEAFVEQLSMAKSLKLPVLVHTPARNKERVTRRAITLIQKSGVTASRVLIDHANEKTLRLITECGHFAGLTIHPDVFSVERAVQLLMKTSHQRLVLSSASGKTAGDLLGLPRLLSRLEGTGLSDAFLERLALANARRFLRL